MDRMDFDEGSSPVSETGRIVCLTCRKHFLDKSKLCRHPVKDSNSRPFTCRICGQRFSEEDYCRLHLEEMHQIVNADHSNKTMTDDVIILSSDDEEANMRPSFSVETAQDENHNISLRLEACMVEENLKAEKKMINGLIWFTKLKKRKKKFCGTCGQKLVKNIDEDMDYKLKSDPLELTPCKSCREHAENKYYSFCQLCRLGPKKPRKNKAWLVMHYLSTHTNAHLKCGFCHQMDPECEKVHNSEKKLQEHISEFHRMLVDSYITTRNILGDC